MCFQALVGFLDWEWVVMQYYYYILAIAITHSYIAMLNGHGLI